MHTTIRSWLFHLPDDKGADGPPGLQITPRGAIAMVEGEQAIQQAIRLLLATKPGERVMRPDYGCHLYRLLFAPNDDTTAGLAIHYVRQALERWEPRIEILTLDAQRPSAAPSRLDILLTYRVRETGAVGQLRYPFELQPDSSA